MGKASLKRSLSVGRERPIPTWLWIFGGYVLVSMSFVATLVAFFDINVDLSGGQRVAVFMLETLSACLAAAVATLIHTTKYYQARAHMYRHGAHVKELYPDRNWLAGHYPDFLQAEKRVVACGISLHTLTTHPKFAPTIEKALTVNKRLRIDLVFCKANSTIVKQREKEEARGHGRISRDCHVNINEALLLKAKLGEKGSRLHVYEIDRFAPIGFFLLSDGVVRDGEPCSEIFYEPYLCESDSAVVAHGSVGRTCPTFRIQRHDQNAAVWDRVAGHLDALVAAASELTQQEVLEPLITPFGLSEERKAIRKAVFLDRDGVLIEDKNYLSNPEGIVVLPGVDVALRALQPEYRLIVITNQSGIARGYFSERDLQEIHLRLLGTLDDKRGVKIDAVYYCPHHPSGSVPLYSKECECRKPKPGLIEQAMARFEVEAVGSFMVGDKAIDVEAGRRAGVKTILISDHAVANASVLADFCVAGLREAADIVLEQ